MKKFLGQPREAGRQSSASGVRKILTSESVNIGHPDKTCDTLADAFLDAALKQDPNAQMAVECAIKNDLLMIYGEATTTARINYEKIAREILRDIGYTCDFRIIKQISEQSPEINKAIVRSELTAGDQGMVYGYACSETPELMPLPIMIAHELMQEYESFRKKDGRFHADAKSQVSVEYDGDKPVRIHTVLVSVSHAETVSNAEIKAIITAKVIDKVLRHYGTVSPQIIVNPSGAFTIWGSFSDSGCVGRKIIVDTYGGIGRHGGGAFSSKSGQKTDRSAAYYARYVAKNIVAKGFAEKCEIQAAYGIGIAKPISLYIETFGTNKKPLMEIQKYVEENFDFRPANIIKELGLQRPIFKETACYGHFGRKGFPWEKVKK